MIRPPRLLLPLLLACALPACHQAPEKPAADASPKAQRAGWAPDDQRWKWLSFQQVGSDKPIALLPVPGKVAPLETQTWSVQAPLPGRLDSLLARQGEAVRQGAPLVQIRSTALADLRREQVLAKRELALHERQARHMRTLSEASAVSERDVLGAEQDVAQAKVNLATNQQKLDALRVDPISDSTYLIRAPHDGVVVASGAKPGEEVGPDKPPLMVLARLDRLVVWAQLLESDLDGIRTGDVATVMDPGRRDRTVTAKVEAISRVVDPEERTVSVRLVTTAAAPWLMPNGYVQVQFRRHQGQAMVVPSEAVLTDDLQSVVFVRHPDGRLERRTVTVGYQTSGQCEIVRGLAPGETIVVKGAILLLNEVEE